MSEKLIKAAAKGEIGLVIQLIKSGVDINFQGRTGTTPLVSAILADRYHCVRVLIRAGADIHREILGLTPLGFAVDTSIDCTIQTGGAPGDEPTDVIKLLIKAGADPETGLRVARRYRNARIEKFLLSRAGDVS
jgi:ankyrin repeat protein